MHSRSPRFSLSLLLCASLAVVGCGDSSTEDATGTGTGTSSKSSTGTKPAGTNDTKSATGDKNTNTGDTKGKDTSNTTSSKTDGPTTSNSPGNTSGTGTGNATGNGTGNGTGTGTGTGNGTGTGSGTGNGNDTGAVKVTFVKDVQPILTASCGCHTGANPKAALDLSAGAAYNSLVGKNSSGKVKNKPFVTPNDVANSYLYGTMNHSVPGGSKMPPTKLDAAKIKVIEDWINDGALKE